MAEDDWWENYFEDDNSSDLFSRNSKDKLLHDGSTIETFDENQICNNEPLSPHTLRDYDVTHQNPSWLSDECDIATNPDTSLQEVTTSSYDAHEDDMETSGQDVIMGNAAPVSKVSQGKERTQAMAKYWRGLTGSKRAVKGHLTRKYIDLAASKGYQLASQNAYRRMRTRCTDRVAADLESGYKDREQRAYRELTTQSRMASGLLPDEMNEIHKMLFLSHGIAAAVAPKVVCYGLKGMTGDQRIWMQSLLSVEDEDRFCKIAKAICDSYLVESRRVYQRNYGVPGPPDQTVENSWNTAARKERCRLVRNASRF